MDELDLDIVLILGAVNLIFNFIIAWIVLDIFKDVARIRYGEKHG